MRHSVSYQHAILHTGSTESHKPAAASYMDAGILFHVSHRKPNVTATTVIANDN